MGLWLNLLVKGLVMSWLSFIVNINMVIVCCICFFEVLNCLVIVGNVGR